MLGMYLIMPPPCPPLPNASAKEKEYFIRECERWKKDLDRQQRQSAIMGGILLAAFAISAPFAIFVLISLFAA